MQTGLSAAIYRRHEPERTTLYGVVEHHLRDLVGQLDRHDAPLPGFVLREFHDYLKCGRLEYGFVRVKCNGCRHEHLVAFSCKCRGFCPSCGARRMADTAAHLVDHVIPSAPVRQWVLSFPWPLRLLFANRPDTLSTCLGIIVRTIETDLIRRAGLRRASGARGGTVTLIQRFGSALNLNVHLHMLILDGVYTPIAQGARFHRVPAPSGTHLTMLLDRIIKRLVRHLTAEGLLVPDPEQPWLKLELHDTFDHLSGASTRYRIAIGPGAGSRTLILKNPALQRETPVSKPFTADRDGFSLNAAVACQPHQRERLERLCRYVTRPAICLDRLTTDATGKVILELKRPFRDGTTHIVFGPEDFMARLAALVPRPRANLTRYHGVFAPNCGLRKAVVPKRSSTPRTGSVPHLSQASDRLTAASDQAAAEPNTHPQAPLTWAQRLKRVFLIDITLCPHCGGTLRVIADVTDPALIERILAHVRKRGPPAPRRAPRTPQQLNLLDAS